jgi:hypothetical protein
MQALRALFGIKKRTVGHQIAEQLRAAIADEEQFDGSWWRARVESVIDGWMALTQAHAPSKAELLAGGRVARLEYRWFRLRRNELIAIRDGIAKTPDAQLGSTNADCLRALATAYATQVGALHHDTWANEWRYYAEALAEIGIKPYHDIPPSFSGQFPDGQLDD